MDYKQFQRYSQTLSIKSNLQPQHITFKSTQNLNLELRDPRYPASSGVEKDDIVETEGAGEVEKPVKQERKITGWRWPVLVISIVSAIFLYCLDTNLTSILIPVLLAEFGEASKLPWIFVGFSLGAITFVLPVGKLYTIFPAKHLYLAFLTLFAIGSGLCGAAQSMNMLIIGRVIAGAGGIGLYTGIIVVLSSITTVEERPSYIGLVGICWSLGRVLGALFGGALGPSSWRWGFYANLVICGLFTPVYLTQIPPLDPLSHPSKNSPTPPLLPRLRTFDHLGAVLNTLILTGLIMGISFGGLQYAWSSPPIILLFTISTISLLLFAIQQKSCFLTTPTTRLFPVAILNIPEIWLVFTVSACCTTGGFLALEYMSLYFQLVRGESTIGAAIRLLPMIGCMAVVMPLTGIVMPKVGHVLWWPIVGSVVAVIGGVGLARLETDTTSLWVYTPQVLLGIGFALYLQIAYATMPSYVPAEQKGNAMTMVIISQMGSIAFCLAIAGSIFTNISLSNLSFLFPDQDRTVLQEAISGTSGEFIKGLSGRQREEVLDVLLGGLRIV
ncbi:major facilitator superfamily domain-containing protein [Rhexocercosporidium sp. MPI-PUGE-AT-0058]|nr:major facilitator superfamily domain-containing protein [Rhexocercosporidium sp. MPI-PUGE-AT-0058]